MKFTYDFIKDNLRVYQEAKQKLPIISEYEKGEITYNAMRNIGLNDFADFFIFISELEKINSSPISAISYKELKEILIENTKVDRFKKWLKNRSLNSFKKLFQEDMEDFDRLLNGRWVTKPGYNTRGRRSWGRRSNECIDGFDIAFIPLLNWIISNDIEVSDKSSNTFEKFNNQPRFSKRLKWYTGVCLDIDKLSLSEIDITHTMLKSVASFVESSNIDFRKLNSDFIIDSFSQKIKNLMKIPDGSIIRSKVDLISGNGIRQSLTCGKDYKVESSMISSGFLRVLIIDDAGFRNWYDYRSFEDKSFERDILLTQLGII